MDTGKAFECNLCGSTGYTESFVAPAMHLSGRQLKNLQYYSYVECSGCGLISQYPYVSEASVDELYGAGSYHELEGMVGAFIERLMPVYYYLARRIPRGNNRNLLDIGAGSGKFLSYAAGRGWRVLGIEHSLEAVKIAGSKRGIKVIPEGEMASLPPDTFDLVTIYHVLEHVDDPRMILDKIYTILKQSGRCIVQIPVLDSLDYYIWRGKSVWIGAPQHKHLFTDRTFAALAAKCGFRVNRITNDWISPQLFVWSLLYEFERRSRVYIPMEYKKVISLVLLPIHLLIAGAAAIFNMSPFKTYYLEKAGPS